MRRLRNRRGVTLILMAVSLVVLIGVAAFAVDFGQMYLYRSQLHAASDAAALAGVERLAKKDFVGAADTGVVYGQLHRVANTTAGITAANVIPGSWNFATSGPFIPAPGGDWTRVENNAVQATTNYTASYGFGRIFGATTRARGATSVAWIGYVGGTECVRPWAMPYQMLLEQLYGAAAPANPYNPSYNLSAMDVQNLAAATSANNILLKIGSASQSVVNGNFYGVALPPQEYANGTQGNPWSGGNDYENGIKQSCQYVRNMMVAQGGSPTIGPNDWLAGENGNMIGPTVQAVRSLCGITTNATVFPCNPPVALKIAIWDTFGDAPNFPSGCGNRCYHVKYIGFFMVTGMTDTPSDGVTGYFSSLTTSGVLSGVPGPLRKLALVQ
jgi:hypothetical protein